MWPEILKKFARRRESVVPESFLTPEALNKCLERERLRCDRTGGIFSLVAIDLVSDQRQRRDMRRLERALARRLRTTDDVGLLKPNCAGALLYDTSGDAAWKVAEDIGQALLASGVAARFRVFEYPNLPDQDKDDDARPRQDKRRVQSLASELAQPLPAWKRLIDVLGSVTGLIFAAPLLLAAAAAIKLSSPGPVFFVQWRSGLGGRPFRMYKLRTMQVDAEQQKAGLRHRSEQDGPAFKMARDPRVTWVGRLLRRTSIDELPQFWNVLRGDMSLVGPRPLPCDEAQACEPWHQRRLDVTPGLTCVWQVRGRSTVAFVDWMRMDLQYVATRSIWRDFSLLVGTLPALLFRKGPR